MTNDTNIASSEKLYARVDNGAVVEFPVTASMIEKRGHAISNYKEVILMAATGSEANLPGFVYETKSEISGGFITMTQVTREKTIHDHLDCFRIPGTSESFTIQQVPVGEFDHFCKAVGRRAEDRLETVVKQRYSSIDTLLGRYSRSTNPIWKKEADFIQKALDGIWSDLINYFANLKSGDVKLPVTIEEVDAVYAIPSWDDLK